jgi:fluoride exporter
MGPALAYGAVAAGAGLGALARYLLAIAALAWLGPQFAWGTLAANVAGSFAICLYVGLSMPGGRLKTGLLADRFVVAGFCGGFTTFSIFSLETLILVEEGRALAAASYVAASLVLWLAAGVAGHALAGRLNGRRVLGAKPPPAP